ncbi:YehR family lipoprotein [Enterococcus sp. BWR-S5]|uniref:YehR family lipoprotein n=1 Tax=Enterococcus sp. BWR-S5 TaxID=2787714 RepID=UPI0019208C2F|nr:YehR family protein [Enterococcus sp. BWR-S5]MBL1224953.1 YehR family protein [Enterococcus sp. BWR-S5]
MKKKQKNWVLWLSLLVVCLIATACSSGEKDSSKKSGTGNGVTTTVFEADLNGVQTEMIYYHKGDKVVKQETNSTINYETLGIESKEEAEEMFSFVKDEYDITGVTYEADYQETKMVEKVSVDYDKADIEEVMSLMGSMTDQEDEGKAVKYISMKQSKEFLLEQGFKEKE